MPHHAAFPPDTLHQHEPHAQYPVPPLSLCLGELPHVFAAAAAAVAAVVAAVVAAA
jgi:hypothetical protein